ncbi:MAG TPA: protein kinase [Anaerolineales bacterium]|nr:protein kinase [Anaerolineales bacterium]
MNPPAPVSPAQPPLAGRYQIRGELGSGGMAHVYQGVDLQLQRPVAIKVLREDLIEAPGFRARFLQEARAAANLAHPNIVTVYDSGVDQGRFFFVMERVAGTDLKTLLRRRGRLPIEEAVGITIQVASGVGYAHRAGLIHCDIKPQNVLVAPDGTAKITDFGIARALSTIDPNESTDVVWGSPQYFAPEQAAGAAPSPASDVYALGVMLYEMVTGRLPFEAENAEHLAELHVTADPLPPRRVNPGIPAPLEQIILKVLSKEPSARYRTADQLARVLTTFAPSRAGAVPVGAPPAADRADPEAYTAAVPRPPEAVDWVAVVLGLIAFLAVGGLIPLWLWACLAYPSCPLR